MKKLATLVIAFLALSLGLMVVTPAIATDSTWKLGPYINPKSTIYYPADGIVKTQIAILYRNSNYYEWVSNSPVGYQIPKGYMFNVQIRLRVLTPAADDGMHIYTINQTISSTDNMVAFYIDRTEKVYEIWTDITAWQMIDSHGQIIYDNAGWTMSGPSFENLEQLPYGQYYTFQKVGGGHWDYSQIIKSIEG